MNHHQHHHHHHPPPSPTAAPPPASPNLNLETSSQVLRQTSSIFYSHLLTFILLSFLILTFRSNVENGTHLLTSFIDRDPSLKTLLSRLDISGTKIHSPSSSSSSAAVNLRRHRHRHRHRRPFLHLTRVGTLDDDFFSGDEDNDRYLFGSLPKSPPNGSFVVLSNFESRLGFSNFVTDNGIRVPDIVRSGVSFKLPESSLQSTVESIEDDNDELKKVKNSLKQGDDETDRFVVFQYLIKSLELRKRDASALFFLVCFLSVAYGYVVLGFLVTYSWVLGVVFVVVVNHLISRRRSWTGTIWDGSNLGLKRLSGLILMRWAVRDALTQLLGLWFFGEMEDQYSFFKIFVRLKLMPFSIMSPWIPGFEKETAGFLFAWLLLDMIVEFVFAVDSWVAIVDARRGGREIVKEGCYLLSTMFKPAVVLKCMESVLCGSFTRWTLARYFGKLFATAFQSTMEVYFMVAWLIFYFAVRSKDATSLGRTFGQRELQGFLVVNGDAKTVGQECVPLLNAGLYCAHNALWLVCLLAVGQFYYGSEMLFVHDTYDRSTSWSRCFGSSMRLEHIAGLGESPEDRCEMEDNIAKNICQEIATLPFSPDPPFSGLMNATGVFLIMLDLVKASRQNPENKLEKRDGALHVH
ncbi:hypothetical protein HYC85_008097 [Camellia sinensis]|uniref:Uncharacterized protein n=1 Tax=Camellia sinensis TaxID=4442 RepID=A0A7J7HSN9_CAMSI|nr:hypothetical protein HYC85_008097 [Camellia sinensis]